MAFYVYKVAISCCFETQNIREALKVMQYLKKYIILTCLGGSDAVICKMCLKVIVHREQSCSINIDKILEDKH